MIVPQSMQNATSHIAVEEEQEISARRIFKTIAAELALVEEEFERQAASDVGVIARIGDYLRATGGKRVRPALLLLSVAAAGGDAARYNSIRMAAVMEFLHAATLVHDDIIDNAEMRRGAPSINSRFGNNAAVLVGDWLYMSAFETSLQERSLEILEILTAVTRKMVEGELIQLTLLGRADISEEQYFDVLRRKTAYLFSACCEIGAILAGADAGSQRALREYGLNIGTAFQLVDDLLDFTATDEMLGKPAGVDLLEGKVTLPLIYLLRREPAFAAAVQEVMRDGSYENFSRAALMSAAEETQALEEARSRASGLAEEARIALHALPASEFRDALDALPAYITMRES
ncbi:MAG: polyprenyl synthetase family protein [Pyrinomonadaceae bacterium]|nr:polyprenyl synthetase family protein [Pyrinomonadaceae bacterium]